MQVVFINHQNDDLTLVSEPLESHDNKMDIEVEDSKNCPVEIVSNENNKSPEVQRRKCGQNVSELLAQYFKW